MAVPCRGTSTAGGRPAFGAVLVYGMWNAEHIHSQRSRLEKPFCIMLPCDLWSAGAAHKPFLHFQAPFRFPPGLRAASPA